LTFFFFLLLLRSGELWIVWIGYLN